MPKLPNCQELSRVLEPFSQIPMLAADSQLPVPGAELPDLGSWRTVLALAAERLARAIL